MSSSLSTCLLRNLPLHELPSELNTLRLRLADDAITTQLLDAVESGSILPSVFAAWFGVCKSPSVVRQSLEQQVSVHIRYLGIQQLKKGLESAQWAALWDGLGGTAGLLELFKDLSVSEVKAACNAIGRCARDGDVINKRVRVTELFKGLHPDVFPDVATKTKDMRPLTKFYQALVPSCTTELVEWMSSSDQDGRWLCVKEQELLEQHSDIIGNIDYQAVFENQSSDAKKKSRLAKLSTRFPSSATSEAGFSASMTFALSLLRKIVNKGVQHVDDEWVISNLIRPLLRRAIRKRASWSKTREITLLAVQFLEQRQSAVKLLAGSKGDVLHMVALCWSRRSTLFEAQLKFLLAAIFKSSSTFSQFSSLLSGVPKSRRYALLRLSCQEVMSVDLDLEETLSSAHGCLTQNLLESIEAPCALGLFTRLRKARGDSDLVDTGLYSSVLNTSQTPGIPGLYGGSPDLYYLVLLCRNGLYGDAESHASKILEARKATTRATSNRDARAERALFVWACASASGSLKLLSETVRWAKGFIRDQLTASKLFSTYHNETYQLLSGFPTCVSRDFTTQDLRRQVEHANAVMEDLIDIACVALHEPFFQPRDWHKTIELFTRVIKERIEGTARMREVLEASSEDIYYAVWEDTIAMLLRVERLANQEEFENLGAGKLSGLVVWKSVFPDTKSTMLNRDTWVFIDNLARARNDMWAGLRPTRYPDVLTLPEPYPRGLALQHLLSLWTPEVAGLFELAPYIHSRVKTAIFVDPGAALKPVPSGKLMQEAVGQFVDSYQYALELYVPDFCEAKEKERRLREVWSYVTGPLSLHRMDTEEALRYWKKVVPWRLQATLSEILPKKERILWPVIPKSDHPSVPEEWNPFQNRPENAIIKARKLGKATYIDVSTLYEPVQITGANIRSPFRFPRPQIPGESGSVGSIWSFHQAGSETEAGILAALLYLDAEYAAANSLLAAPFPSPNDVRYPCLFLDEEFLSSKDLLTREAVSYVATNIKYAPLPLVHRIATTMVGKLGTNQPAPSHILENAAFTLIRALIESDRPRIAFELSIKVIIEQPSASSWHRLLFYNGFLQRIPASHARICISTYAEAIGRKLDAQKLSASSAAKAEQVKNSDNSYTSTSQARGAQLTNQPFVKLTTLKSLAQILQGSTYIADDASLEILSGLAQRVSHIDVRVSILKTLLSKLDVKRPELWDCIFLALESFVALAGSLNERDPTAQIALDRAWSGTYESQKRKTLREIDAEMAEYFPSTAGKENAELSENVLSNWIVDTLEISNPAWQEEWPMLGAIFNFYSQLDGGHLSDLFLGRIIVPTLDLLEMQTTKWTTLFLKKHGSNDAELMETLLPPVPKTIQTVDFILSKAGTESIRVPQTILDKYVSYIMFRLKPPAPIFRLNKIFEDSPALKSTPEVKTWLELYGSHATLSWSYILPFGRISSFDAEGAKDNDTHITPRTYQDAFLEIFVALLWADDPGYMQLTAFASTLTQGTSMDKLCWNRYGRVTLEAMIAYVNGIRTKEWERDPNRTPAVLPDTFVWRLALLLPPLKIASDQNDDKEHICRAFAQQLAAVVDEISGSLYHIRLQQIKNHLRNIHDMGLQNNLLLSAFYLGDISKTRLSWLTTPELLRVDLAAEMIMRSQGLDVENLGERAKALLSTWVASENEEVRRLGYRVRRKCYSADGQWLHNSYTW